MGGGQKFKEDKVMPKMKTKRAAAKRYKVTGSGKIVRMKANKSHILNKKTAKRKLLWCELFYQGKMSGIIDGSRRQKSSPGGEDFTL